MTTTDRPAPTIDIEVQAVMDGYPITIRKAGATTEQLDLIISRLMAIGAVPPAPPSVAAPAANGGAVSAPGFATPPICNLHKRPMKLSSKPGGGWFCSAKLADETYCKEKA